MNTYDKILNISDISEKNDALKNFYLNEIEIEKWMTNDKFQKILFHNRFEIKKDNKYHNINGPAIKYKNGDEFFYIEGKYYEDKSEWEKIVKRKKRKKVITKILK